MPSATCPDDKVLVLEGICTCERIGTFPNAIQYGFKSGDLMFTLTNGSAVAVSGSYYTECGLGESPILLPPALS